MDLVVVVRMGGLDGFFVVILVFSLYSFVSVEGKSWELDFVRILV